MAHPIRPESYIAMDNFYTMTVYYKGAEVIRMYHSLLGEKLFRKGMDLYFERHDGCAVTCDDFRKAMADASGRDLTQFERWYTQAGTPVLKVEGTYVPGESRYELKVTQSCAPTPAEASTTKKLPFHMPIKVGLIGKKDKKEIVPTTLCELTKDSQTFEFKGVTQEPVVSVLRGFSAPVKLEMETSDEELAFLMAFDTDDFNRWEAGQRLMTRVLLSVYEEVKAGKKDPKVPESFVQAAKEVLTSEAKDQQLQAYMLILPGETTLSGFLKDAIDPAALHEARVHVKKTIAKSLESIFRAKYKTLSTGEKYKLTAGEVGRRAMRNLCLGYLMASEAKDASAVAATHFKEANSMTDKLSALGALVDLPAESEERQAALKAFYEDANGDALVIDKWFMLQAAASSSDTLKNVKALSKHEGFTLKNPNRVRSLYGAFGGNMHIFHGEDGKGYEFLADVIIQLDSINPQIAARLLGSFAMWKKFDEKRQAMMKAQLLRILDKKGGLSADVFEVASKYAKA